MYHDLFNIAACELMQGDVGNFNAGFNHFYLSNLVIETANANDSICWDCHQSVSYWLNDFYAADSKPETVKIFIYSV